VVSLLGEQSLIPLTQQVCSVEDGGGIHNFQEQSTLIVTAVAAAWSFSSSFFFFCCGDIN
jgi:hypothetical protein